MQISKLLKLNQDLAELDFSRIEKDILTKQIDLQSIIDTNGSFSEHDPRQDIQESLNGILRARDRIKQAIIQNEEKINSLAQSYFETSYRKYETELKYASVEHIQHNCKQYIHPRTRSEIEGRIGQYIDWKYPGLEIGPGDGVWTHHLVGCDPLYIVDIHTEFLESTKARFNAEYRNKICAYKTNNYDLSMIPQGQIGFAFSWNTFNYFPLETIKNYLKSILGVLRPGGVFMFSYNNCEMPKQAEAVERGAMCYTPKTTLLNLIELLGFEVLKASDRDSFISWLEIRKPGELSSRKAAPVLGKIISTKSVDC